MGDCQANKVKYQLLILIFFFKKYICFYHVLSIILSSGYHAHIIVIEIELLKLPSFNVHDVIKLDCIKILSFNL